MQFIDLNRQYLALKEEIDSNIAQVLTKSNYIGGEEVKQLAEELSEYCGVQRCLTCANGTDALTIALRALGVGRGDAVFVPAFTFFASAEAPALEGAECVFVDVCERTFNMDAEKLEEAILKTKKKGKYTPKCILTVDLFGLPADYPAIRTVADRYGLPILEDSAQGFGGSIDGKKACSFGDIATTSFFPAKPLGCYGDGGAIFTDREDRYKLMSSLAVHGKGAYKYDNVRIGYNSRLDTLQAAILLPKLKAFRNYELTARNEAARLYTERLKGYYITPLIPDGYESSWAQYTLILESRAQREYVQNALKAKGIPTMVYYPLPMHLQTAFADKGYLRGDFPISELLCDSVLSIPMHPYLTVDEIDMVCEELTSASR